MADKGLKGMSRGELLELLIAQMEENERLQKELEEAQARLKNRRINIDKAGSIAEASLLLNGVFQAAEDAAAQYLENVRMLQGRQDKICRQMEEEAMQNARQKADAIVAEAMQNARQKADAIVAEAKQKAEATMKEAEDYSRKQREDTLAHCKQMIKRAQILSGES